MKGLWSWCRVPAGDRLEKYCTGKFKDGSFGSPWSVKVARSGDLYGAAGSSLQGTGWLGAERIGEPGAVRMDALWSRRNRWFRCCGAEASQRAVGSLLRSGGGEVASVRSVGSAHFRWSRYRVVKAWCSEVGCHGQSPAQPVQCLSQQQPYLRGTGPAWPMSDSTAALTPRHRPSVPYDSLHSSPASEAPAQPVLCLTLHQPYLRGTGPACPVSVLTEALPQRHWPNLPYDSLYSSPTSEAPAQPVLCLTLHQPYLRGTGPACPVSVSTAALPQRHRPSLSSVCLDSSPTSEAPAQHALCLTLQQPYPPGTGPACPVYVSTASLPQRHRPSLPFDSLYTSPTSEAPPQPVLYLTPHCPACAMTHSTAALPQRHRPILPYDSLYSSRTSEAPPSLPYDSLYSSPTSEALVQPALCLSLPQRHRPSLSCV
ncbi:hypothetical protein NDU88_007476 [Pleurodeles waltl]|uniref:Uncharacterized protein n=1 Tax=Pleurodeles waltl TaxID=8319 RepID=A0AAV7WHH9_PLEWA|nr:hypothetical protein NDU88_007476 [Pleurodeles waltl]